MKYSILGFKQEWLVNEAENSGCKIDITDLIILRWVIELMSKDNAKKKVINGKEYVWVNYNTLIDDMPILGIKKRALRERLKDLEEFGLLTHYHDLSNGSYSYYGEGELLRNALYKGIGNITDTDIYISNYLFNEKKTATIRDIRSSKINIDWGKVEATIKGMKYLDFLQTTYWKTIARAVRRKYKNKCAICGSSSEKLNVHHRNYDCHGKEHKHYKTDLICLCENCHKKFHDKIAD